MTVPEAPSLSIARGFPVETSSPHTLPVYMVRSGGSGTAYGPGHPSGHRGTVGDTQGFGDEDRRTVPCVQSRTACCACSASLAPLGKTCVSQHMASAGCSSYGKMGEEGSTVWTSHLLFVHDRNAVLTQAPRGVRLENVVLSERSQTQKLCVV